MARHNSPTYIWELALDYVIFTRNRVVDSLRNDGKSLDERMSGVIPDLSIARPFDAPCWAFIYKEERKGVHAVFRPHVRMGRMVGYSKIVPGSYLVLDHNQTIYTRPQVFCKEYPGLVGLEGLTKESDPIDDDGKILDYEILHEKRMQGDRELRDLNSRLPGDRQEPDSGNDEDYWPTESPIEKPQTRQLVKEQDA
jgi:hypothetical protein